MLQSHSHQSHLRAHSLQVTWYYFSAAWPLVVPVQQRLLWTLWQQFTKCFLPSLPPTYSSRSNMQFKDAKAESVPKPGAQGQWEMGLARHGEAAHGLITSEACRAACLGLSLYFYAKENIFAQRNINFPSTLIIISSWASRLSDL